MTVTNSNNFPAFFFFFFLLGPLLSNSGSPMLQGMNLPTAVVIPPFQKCLKYRTFENEAYRLRHHLWKVLFLWPVCYHTDLGDTNMDRIQLKETTISVLSHHVVLSLSCSFLSHCASPSFCNAVHMPLACHPDSLPRRLGKKWHWILSLKAIAILSTRFLN